MAHTTQLMAAAVLSQGLLDGSAGELRTLLSAGLVLIAMSLLFTTLRRVTQVVTALAAAATAVGSVLLIVAVFIGLLAAALVLNVTV